MGDPSQGPNTFWDDLDSDPEFRVPEPTGDATTDTAYLVAAIAAVTPPRASITTTVTCTAAIVLQAGTYVLNVDQVQWRNLQGVRVRGQGKLVTKLRIVGTGTNGLDVNGVAYSLFSDFTVYCDGTITNAINWHWGDFPTGRSCSDVTFDHVDVFLGTGTFITAFAVGTDHSGSGPQVDGGHFVKCVVAGNFPGDNTHFTNGFLLGNGTVGNNYNHEFINSYGGSLGKQVNSQDSGFWWFGGEPTTNSIDFNILGAYAGVTIQSVQTQQSAQFLVTAGSSTEMAISVRDIFVSGFTNASGQWASLEGVQSVIMENIRVVPSASQVPTIAVQAGAGPYNLTLRNVASQATLAQFLNVPSKAPDINAVIDNYVQLLTNNSQISAVVPHYVAQIPTTVNGTTAGTAVWTMPEQGTSYKRFVVYLNGYENTTATAQTITFPTAFTSAAVVTTPALSPAPTVSLTTLTLPASMGATLSGLVLVEGL